MNSAFKSGVVLGLLVVAWTFTMGITGWYIHPKSESGVKAFLDAQAPTQTTFAQALFGFLGTMVTGLIVSLIAAAFLKGKPATETKS